MLAECTCGSQTTLCVACQVQWPFGRTDGLPVFMRVWKDTQGQTVQWNEQVPGAQLDPGVLTDGIWLDGVPQLNTTVGVTAGMKFFLAAHQNAGGDQSVVAVASREDWDGKPFGFDSNSCQYVEIGRRGTLDASVLTRTRVSEFYLSGTELKFPNGLPPGSPPGANPFELVAYHEGYVTWARGGSLPDTFTFHGEPGYGRYYSEPVFIPPITRPVVETFSNSPPGGGGWAVDCYYDVQTVFYLYESSYYQGDRPARPPAFFSPYFGKTKTYDGRAVTLLGTPPSTFKCPQVTSEYDFTDLRTVPVLPGAGGPDQQFKFLNPWGRVNHGEIVTAARHDPDANGQRGLFSADSNGGHTTLTEARQGMRFFYFPADLERASIVVSTHADVYRRNYPPNLSGEVKSGAGWADPTFGCGSTYGVILQRTGPNSGVGGQFLGQSFNAGVAARYFLQPDKEPLFTVHCHCDFSAYQEFKDIPTFDPVPCNYFGTVHLEATYKVHGTAITFGAGPGVTPFTGPAPLQRFFTVGDRLCQTITDPETGESIRRTLYPVHCGRLTSYPFPSETSWVGAEGVETADEARHAYADDPALLWSTLSDLTTDEGVYQSAVWAVRHFAMDFNYRPTTGNNIPVEGYDLGIELTFERTNGVTGGYASLEGNGAFFGRGTYPLTGHGGGDAGMWVGEAVGGLATIVAKTKGDEFVYQDRIGVEHVTLVGCGNVVDLRSSEYADDDLRDVPLPDRLRWDGFGVPPDWTTPGEWDVAVDRNGRPWRTSEFLSTNDRRANAGNTYRAVAGGQTTPDAAGWRPAETLAVGQFRHTGTNPNERVYVVGTAGITSDDPTAGPTGEGTGIEDGTVRWDYVGRLRGPIGTGDAIRDNQCVWRSVGPAPTVEPGGSADHPRIKRTVVTHHPFTYSVNVRRVMGGRFRWVDMVVTEGACSGGSGSGGGGDPPVENPPRDDPPRIILPGEPLPDTGTFVIAPPPSAFVAGQGLDDWEEV
jgi:hypothetical protein